MTLARPDHLDTLMRLVADFHHEAGIAQDESERRAALAPLLEGSPHGAIYLAGPVRAPIGYIVVTFGWSVSSGGLDGFVDELYVRPGVRQRGIGTEMLLSLPKTLARAGLRAIHVETGRHGARSLFSRAGFRPREETMLMSRRF
ncbi:GNAT family N-acetyltransferase [Roseovarius salis]|uniref:GNAT family N-acetyltransferase n=1 Tax=Roseovarius salis TaxID=3376063 RepID=UPI0037C5A5AF